MGQATAARPQAGTVLLRPLFVLTILTGSFLLFLIQPMFARMILPLLGGSPSVWNVAMLFYQAVLLGGYLYAHALQRLPLRTQIGIHLGLLGLAALTLPVAVANWFPAEGAAPPALWLLGLLAASIGPVFFAVSAQAPLMQAWFARSPDPAAASPFFLYAASNAGSLAALLAYPLLLEPNSRLATQSGLWAAGFALLALLVAAAGLSVVRAGDIPLPAGDARSVTWRQRGRWTLLAFVPSGLLLSTTTHLTTDVMAMPLLWVIPLALYLLTFIIAFSSARAARAAEFAAPLLLVMLGAVAVFPTQGAAGPWGAVASLLLLFVVALALHGRLSAERPAAADLTEFYLWISVGGVLGGLFCALLAPWLFDWVYEHPILLLTAAALIPAPVPGPVIASLWAGRQTGPLMRYVVPILCVALVVAVGSDYSPARPLTLVSAMLVMLAAFLSIGHRRQFVWSLLMLLMLMNGTVQLRISGTPDARIRTFFGINAIGTDAATQSRRLYHGTTLHGIQSLGARDRLRPSSYFAPGSGAGIVYRALPALAGDHARVGIIGLGAGTLTCYARPGQDWTVFEIDPAVVHIARDTGQFTFISGCKPDLKIILGDARLSLQPVPPASFDLFTVDAFSSDAIPLHLMTREAFALYGRVLTSEGILLIHVSNRYLALEPVVAAIARSRGWTAMVRNYVPAPAERVRGDAPSTWIAMTRTPERMAALVAATGADAWEPLRPEPGIPAWSDDFASVLPVIRAFRHDAPRTAPYSPTR